MKLLYRGMVTLHPPAFRRQFGSEMELIFDESGRPPQLLADVFLSLVRQWFLRSQIWIFALAAIGGFIPFALGFGFLNMILRWFGVNPTVNPHVHAAVIRTVSEPVSEPFIMITATIAVMFISGTMCFAISWFRYSQRRRKA